MIPELRGSEAYRLLRDRYGLPNAIPTENKSVFNTDRFLFVDDTRNGMPIVFWQKLRPGHLEVYGML